MSKKKKAHKSESAHLAFASRHLRWGWWSLLAFLSLGLVLEAMHGLKIDAYLSVANQTRRLMWTLAHTHGTLLGLVHIALGVTLRSSDSWPKGTLKTASKALIGAGILLPLGFFLGGVIFHEGDPGPGVLLVPVGGVLLVAAVFLVASGLNRSSTN